MEMVQYTAGMFGGPEVVIILVVILLLFGGRKIPELAKGIGKGIREFRNATDESNLAQDLKDVKSEFDEVKKDVEKLDPRKSFKSGEPKSSKKK